MKYFTTVRAALDNSLPGICRHYGIPAENILPYVKTHLQAMNKEWFSGEAPLIAYHDPICRLGYLFCHTAVNANLCEFAIRSSPDLVAFIRQKMDADQELRVCAFGGGPGTELLAICKHLTKTRPHGPLARLSFTLLDRVPEWSETWNALESRINDELRASGLPIAQWPFSISKAFVPYDMTQVANYANMSHLFQQDFYVMNYVVSEIVGSQANFEAVLQTAAMSSPAGCKFLIVDRDQEPVKASARALLMAAGLNVGEASQTIANMDMDEQSSVLDPYIHAIGYRPRVQWGNSYNQRGGAFWMIGTKP